MFTVTGSKESISSIETCKKCFDFNNLFLDTFELHSYTAKQKIGRERISRNVRKSFDLLNHLVKHQLLCYTFFICLRYLKAMLQF